MPGGIDPHTHLEMPFMGTTAVDDFYTCASHDLLTELPLIDRSDVIPTRTVSHGAQESTSPGNT